MYGDYNSYGRQQTGFDNSIDHLTFGNWRNSEYQEICQEAEISERENAERYKKSENSENKDDSLPF